MNLKKTLNIDRIISISWKDIVYCLYKKFWNKEKTLI